MRVRSHHQQDTAVWTPSERVGIANAFQKSACSAGNDEPEQAIGEEEPGEIQGRGEPSAKGHVASASEPGAAATDECTS
jgi:hypothetical protein